MPDDGIELIRAVKVSADLEDLHPGHRDHRASEAPSHDLANAWAMAELSVYVTPAGA